MNIYFARQYTWTCKISKKLSLLFFLKELVLNKTDQSQITNEQASLPLNQSRIVWAGPGCSSFLVGTAPEQKINRTTFSNEEKKNAVYQFRDQFARK